MPDVATRIAALSPRKRFLLEKLREEKARHRPAPPRQEVRSVPFSLVREEDRRRLPGEVEDAYPLAQMQMGMLFHLQLTLDDPVPAYHNVFMYTLGMPLQIPVLRQAIEQIVHRHPILRTAFDLASFSQPLQLVHRRVEVSLPEIDLTRLAPEDREKELDRFLKLENRRVIDIARPPLLRFFVHRVGEDRFQLTMTELHAIAEGWGTYRTLSAFHDAYFALREGKPLPAEPPSPATYRDFIGREQAALRSSEHRAFWERALAGTTTTRLPRWPNWARPVRRSRERARVFAVPASIQEGLQRFVQQTGLPLKSVLLAAHLKALSLLAGRRLLSGLSVHNRPEELGSEYLLGVFVNTVPLPLVVERGSWEQLVRRVFEAELELMPHQLYPVAALQRRWGKEALVEVAFGHANFHLFGEAAWFEGIQVRNGADWSVSHFPLVVFFRGVPPDLSLWMENDDTVFTEPQVKALRGYFLNVLAAMASAPGAMHHGRCYLMAEELHQQLVEWNDTARPELLESVAPSLWDARVLRSPDAVALVHGEHHVSCAELDRRAGRLAAALRRRGIGREDRVGLAMGRRPELLASILGVWKAGAAFVPLDPSHPVERRLHIVRQAGLAALLDVGGGQEPAFGGGVAHIDVASLAGEDRAQPSLPRLEPEQLAYVLYTSGSTGEPKGVMVSHRSLANYLSWSLAAYDVAAGGGAPVHSSTAVDMTVTSLLCPLLAGGPAVLVPEGEPGQVLEATLELAGGFSFVKVTPSHLQVLSQRLPPAAARSWTRLLVVGGEQLRSEQLAFLREHAPATRVVNEYGPTEAVVGCSVHEVSHDAQGPVPIGRPIGNARLHVLDDDLHPVPPGATGELFIGGDCLSRGYLGHPEATAERFVPDVSGAQPGGRLYRTGDLARRHPDGVLEYIGRNDQQVKIRGFRVELGEVEAALGRHPGVAGVAVQALPDGAGGQRLVAYLAPVAAEALRVSELRSFLHTLLPEAMIPSVFVTLDSLPLTPAGKVDRRALPEPEVRRPDLEGEAVPPRNQVERALARVWCEELGITEVGVHDNFFDLGGDSLRLLRTQAKVRQVVGRDFPISALFRFPTLALLAAHLSGEEEAGPHTAGGEERASRRQASQDRRAALREQRRAARQEEGSLHG